MSQKEIELILLRQCASHLAMPIWLMGENGDLLYYNEPAEPILGRRFERGDRAAKASLSFASRCSHWEASGARRGIPNVKALSICRHFVAQRGDKPREENCQDGTRVTVFRYETGINMTCQDGLGRAVAIF